MTGEQIRQIIEQSLNSVYAGEALRQKEGVQDIQHTGNKQSAGTNVVGAPYRQAGTWTSD